MQKTTKLIDIKLTTPDSSSPGFEEAILYLNWEDIWDDPEDDDFPIVKRRVEVRGRAAEEDESIRTPIDDLPTWVRDILRVVWRYD